MEALFWGRSTIDITYMLDEYPNENDKTFASNYLLQPGGPALNSAITFAKHSGSAFLLSGIGNNNFGKLVKSVLNQNKINVLDLHNNDYFQIPLATIFINSING